jgi:ketosteroid isomerase-like protein
MMFSTIKGKIGPMDLDKISAYLEIQQALYTYCRGIDRGDSELIKSIYHPDATDEHGLFKGKGMKFAEVIVGEMEKRSANGQHHITNILIDLDGDVARVESYFISLNPEVSPEGSVAPVTGRYLDRFEKKDGAWKIAHRQVVLDYSYSALPIGHWELHEKFPNGAKREHDPSFTFFKNK